MITKAGAPSNKVIFGQPLYGRSFRMITPGCYTAECRYIGPESGAAPGPYTGTAGYISNYEIREIIANGSSSTTPSSYGGVQEYYSEDAGNVLVYNDVQWVSWVNSSVYDNRTQWIRSLNFGGIVDWAMDLNATYPDRAVASSSSSSLSSTATLSSMLGSTPLPGIETSTSQMPVEIVTISVTETACSTMYR